MIDVYILKEHIENLTTGRVELRDQNGDRIADIERTYNSGLYIGFSTPGASYSGLVHIDEAELKVRGSTELCISSDSNGSRVILYAYSFASMEVVDL